LPALVLLAAPAAAAAQAHRPAPSSAWSRPARLAAACAPTQPPRVVFPSEGPSLRTGPGAVVWATSPGGCGAATAASGESAQLGVARLGAGERPAGAVVRPLRGALVRSLDAVGTSFGRIAVMTSFEAATGTPAGQVLQGRAPALAGGFSAHSYGAGPVLAHAYLGDAAAASVRRGAIAVRVERHYQRSFGHAELIPIRSQPVSALAITMDFRADVLVVWEQGGSVYAHMLRQSGRTDPTQRVGPSAPAPVLQALVSDNDHGMVAWSTTRGPRTSVYLDLSQAGVTFAPARELVAFDDPARVGERPGSLALTRLSTENVVMAWTALERGHYVVRSAPAVFASSRPAARLSNPAGQSVLAALAPGAAGEAVAVWTGTSAASADPRAGLAALWAARVGIVPGDRVQARPASLLAEPGAGAAASAAVDPASDRALVAWRDPASGAIEYSTAAASPAYSQRAPRGSAPPPSAGVHWVRIAAACLLALALALAAALLWRRRAQRAGRELAGSRERRL
jgi:hypothetical protein